jgi:3-hydroxyisobutyrate dehydrogenase
MKNILPVNPVIGWIGTGVMGNSMLSHLIDKGYETCVFTRTREKADTVILKGSQWCPSIPLLCEHADIVFSMVGFPADVRQVYLSPDGLLNHARKGCVLIDMTTTSPGIATEIYETAVSGNMHFLDAPVSGGDVGARNATLSIMVGGDSDVFEAVKPYFEILGRKIIYQGKAGSGMHTKMCNQIQIAGTMIGMCESLLYGYRAGLDLQVMLSSISGGAAACWSLDNLAPRILRRDFEPGFFVDHFIKDMGIALEEARKMEISLPGLALVNQLYISVKALGYGRKGTQALILALESMADLKIE